MKKTAYLIFVNLIFLLSLFMFACNRNSIKTFETYKITVQNDSGFFSDMIPGSLTFLKSDTPPGNSIKNDTLDAFQKKADGKNEKVEGKALAVYFTDAARTTLYDPRTFTSKTDASLYVKAIDAPAPVVTLGSGKTGTELNPLEPLNNQTDAERRPVLYWRIKNTVGWTISYKLLLDEVDPPVAEITFKDSKGDLVPIRKTSVVLTTQLKNATKYYWTVIAVDGNGKEYPSADKFSFTTR